MMLCKTKEKLEFLLHQVANLGPTNCEWQKFFPSLVII